MIIRKERETDIEAITQVTREAFANHPISNQTEEFIIHALRSAGALTLSLVAEVEGQVVGHIAFSPVTITDDTPDWYGLGPVSVLPKWQKKGIGQSLIKEGLAMLRELDGQGIALVGDPTYYQKFGFRNVPQLVHEGVPPEVFQILPLKDSGEKLPKGNVVFHEGFWATK